MPIYERVFAVSGRDVDPQDRVRADALGLMLQESAAHHADNWGMSVPALIAQGRTWVLARVAMSFEGPRPGWKSELKVETWSRGFRGHLATRDSLIKTLDGKTPGAIVARASSSWFVIDLNSRKPVRLTDDYVGLDAAEPGLLSGVETGARMDLPKEGAREVPLAVRASDLDLNGHVNNVRYIEWLYEAVPLEVLAERRLARLDLNYTGETPYPCQVCLRSWPLPEAPEAAMGSLVYVHSFLREDGTEVIRARTVWVMAGQAL